MALALTREAGETIWVGDAQVTVVWVAGKKVRIAVEAPRSTPVVRGELRRADQGGESRAKVA